MRENVKLAIIAEIATKHSIKDIAEILWIEYAMLESKYSSIMYLISRLSQEEGFKNVSKNLGIPQKRWQNIIPYKYIDILMPSRGMKIYYGYKILELRCRLMPDQALEVIRGAGNTEYTKAEGLPNGDVVLSQG